MSHRPPAGATRLNTGARPPPYRMPTGAGVVPGSARPGSRAGMAGLGALSSQLKVADRPVTQQGLGGMKTGSKGPMRQVYDKSYYMGLLRAKTQELSQEIARLSQEIDSHQKESSTYLSYEQRAETLAEEIKDLRGTLADYNTMMDKVNTDTEQATIVADTTALCLQNDTESNNIDAIFAEKQEQEKKVRELEEEIERERRAAEPLVASMDTSSQERYRKLKAEILSNEKELTEKRSTLDELNSKAQELREELGGSELKLESWRLHQQLAEVEEKRRKWSEKEKETPHEERERLLRQVKEDNQEMAAVQRSSAELQEKLEGVRERVRMAEGELEEESLERSTKYRELKGREEKIQEFMDNFEKSKAEEEETMRELEMNIITLLEHISQSMTQSQQLPSQEEYEELQADVAFKQEEKEKSEATTRTLDSENAKLQLDLTRVEELEGKITQELQMLKEGIETMTQEIDQFSDIEGLQIRGEKWKQELEEEKERLLVAMEEAKRRTEALDSEYKNAKAQLEANDTHIQLGNLERKWQHHEQNNFAMKEYIASRQAEGSYQQVSVEVAGLVSSYNTLLCRALQTTAPTTS